MSRITARGQGSPLDVFQVSTDTALQTLVGSKWDLSDGREVALGFAAAATTVAPGYFYQNAALIAGEQAVTITSFTAASSTTGLPASIKLTSGSSTAVAANAFQGGTVVVVSATGIGQTLKIASNSAATAGNSYVYTITLEDSPITALDATSVINVIPQVGYNVVISPAAASLTNTLFGVGLYVIAPSSFGFFVTRGNTALVAVSAGVAAGSALSVGTAGAAIVFSGAIPVLGHTGAALTASSANIAYVQL